MLCPSCKVDLVIADRQGIEIDYCPRCRGVWLDRGELDKIIDRALTSISRARPPDRDRDFEDRDDRRSERRDSREYAKYEEERHRKRKKSFLGELFDFG